jgi:tetratricopeptide (TPR) repeat protein
MPHYTAPDRLLARALKALTEFERAAELLPESVAAKSLLANTCIKAGQLIRALQLWKHVQELTPASAEDFLFKGDCATICAPNEAAQLMDKAIRLHDSVIGRYKRAEVRAHRAIDSGDSKEAESAVADAEIAKGMLPDSPSVLSTCVKAHLAAASAYEELGQAKQSSAELLMAEKDKRALERYDTLPQAIQGRGYYYSYLMQGFGDLEVLGRAAKQGTTNAVLLEYAWSLYLRGELSRALAVLDSSKGNDIVFVTTPRIIILAELPGGRAKAVQVCRDLAASGKVEQIYNVECMLLFLGLKPEAVALANRSLGPDNDQRFPWLPSMLEYIRGNSSAEGLVKAAGPSKLGQCRCHYIIALMKLAEGDRRGAREHFVKSVATRCFTSLSHGLSWAFLTCLDKDPTWPTWIPMK